MELFIVLYGNLYSLIIRVAKTETTGYIQERNTSLC